jgi:two-component system response regulator HydG
VTPQALSALLIGESVPMRQLRALVARIAASALPVLIEGETGSGKELVARALHAGSGRTGPLVALNVCAVSDSMFESTMFGHVRGAFTGAVHDTAGYLTEAHRGTLFLDEVSGLSLGNQVKLLRAIETKEFRPLGGRSDQRSDFRVVAASNESIPGLVQRSRFRQDLAQRLAGIRVAVPALRHRMEDVPLLAAHFATQATSGGEADIVIGPGAMRRLLAHSWPGNVRELRHVVEASITLSHGQVEEQDVAELIRPRAGGIADRRRESRQRDLLTELARCAWNVDEVASEMGVHRATVYRRLRRLGDAELGGGALRVRPETPPAS